MHALTEEIERIVAEGGDADDVLRGVVETLGRTFAWAGISFVEAGELVLGPSYGNPAAECRHGTPVVYDGREVARLEVDNVADEQLLERVATLISPYCLVGWDTGGERWAP